MALFVDLSPSVFQPNGLVKYQMVGCRVQIGCEVSNALELQEVTSFLLLQVRLYITVVKHTERVGVQQVAEVALVSTRILDREQTVVQTNLSLYSILAIYPVQGFALNLTVGTRLSTASLWIVGRINGGYITFCILVAGVLLVY